MQEALNSKKDTINDLNQKLQVAQSDITLLNRKLKLVEDDNINLKE
jgi:hypothetical protein